MIDLYASEPHYAEHLAPIAAAIPGSMFCAGTNEVAATLERVLSGYCLNAARPEIRVCRPSAQGVQPLVVASARDYTRSPATRRRALLEHGAGQTYVDAPRSTFYAGGDGYDAAALILAPGPHSARRWRDRYPAVPVVELGGSPRLDGHAIRHLVQRLDDALVRERCSLCNQPLTYGYGSWSDPSGSIFCMTGDSAGRRHTILAPREHDHATSTDATDATPRTTLPVVVSFHWDWRVVPEARSTHKHWAAAVAELAKDREVLGHGHPRAWSALEPWYRRHGIEPVRTFDEVLARGGLYVCDNSSTMFEWAGLGRPVLCLNAPSYRRDVEHGLRFWDHAPGNMISLPEVLAPRVEYEEQPSEHGEAVRDRACMEAYGMARFDGQATARAVAAIREHLL